MTDEEKSPTGHGRAEESSTNQTNNPSVPHTQGSAAPMPSSESAELATLLDAFVAIFKKHLSLPEGAPEAMALWVVSAHNLDSSNFAPRLGLSSPLPECGKTTALDVLSGVVPEPVTASNASPAVIYRFLGQKRFTFLFDEGETFMDGKAELNGIIDSGHSRTSAYVLRTGSQKRNFAPEKFPTFCPMVIARIGDFNGVLETRSIVIRMQRKRPDEITKPINSVDRDLFVTLNARLAAWSKANGAKLKDADPKMPDGFWNRQADNWRHLLAIADLAGPEWGTRARKAATLTEGPHESLIEERLFAGIKQAYDELGVLKIPSADLASHHALYDATGTTWTPTTLATVLRRFGIRPKSIRIDARHTPKGYLRSQFEDHWTRYISRRTPPSDSDGEEGG